jgi:hypothetical protein
LRDEDWEWRKMRILEEIRMWMFRILCMGWLPSMIFWFIKYGNTPFLEVFLLPISAVGWGILNILWMVGGLICFFLSFG